MLEPSYGRNFTAAVDSVGLLGVQIQRKALVGIESTAIAAAVQRQMRCTC
jgi:hypothetical protein